MNQTIDKLLKYINVFFNWLDGIGFQDIVSLFSAIVAFSAVLISYMVFKNNNNNSKLQMEFKIKEMLDNVRKTIINSPDDVSQEFQTMLFEEFLDCFEFACAMYYTKNAVSKKRFRKMFEFSILGIFVDETRCKFVYEQEEVYLYLKRYHKNRGRLKRIKNCLKSAVKLVMKLLFNVLKKIVFCVKGWFV